MAGHGIGRAATPAKGRGGSDHDGEINGGTGLGLFFFSFFSVLPVQFF
jgi:hypothetical protein